MSINNVPATKSEIFWAETAPCDHVVQIYNTDGRFMNSLYGFVASGLRATEGVVVLGLPMHLQSLERRLSVHGFDLCAVQASNQYIAMNAEEALDQFMVNGWPNDELFRRFVDKTLFRARGNGRRVRAFGEMVAILWARGLGEATVRLEHLWHRYCQERSLSLFCAYPRSGFTPDADLSFKAIICAAHSRVIVG